MALVIVASQHGTAVRIYDVAAPEGVEPAYAEILGNRAPGSVEGYGLTYDVDDAIFNGWAAAFPDISAGMKITDEAEIDTWRDAANHYGYELGLQGATAANEADPRIAAIQEAQTALDAARAKLAEDQRAVTIAEAKVVRVTATPAPSPRPPAPPAPAPAAPPPAREA
jgi:hypothetical protein